MDKFEFAKMLDGRQIGQEITVEECLLAQELGLVVVFGHSDDGIIIEGNIDGYVGAYNGVTVYIDKEGLIKCKCECKYYKKALENAKEIEAIWDEGREFVWSYKTDIPHATFEIYEEEECYCKGIVFDINDL